MGILILVIGCGEQKAPDAPGKKAALSPENQVTRPEAGSFDNRGVTSRNPRPGSFPAGNSGSYDTNSPQPVPAPATGLSTSPAPTPGAAATTASSVPAANTTTATPDDTVAGQTLPAYPVCGGPGDSCYDHSEAKSAGNAVTPGEKILEYVSNGHRKIWKEAGGDRILRANGLDEWAMKVNYNGKGFSQDYFTGLDLITQRKCPPNVYINDNRKFTENNCLYITREYPARQVQEAGKSQTNFGSLGLVYWSDYTNGKNDPRWMVGNIQKCANAGMRLPTAFETTIEGSSGNFPTADGDPVFAGPAGVPSDSGGTWTATSHVKASDVSNGWTNGYWQWNGTSGGKDWSSNARYVRCVLP